MMDNGGTAVLQRFDVKVKPGTKLGTVYSRDAVPIRKEKSSDSFCGNKSDKKQNLLKCGMCKEVFISFHDISNHLKHHHIQIQVFDCGVCLKFFPFHTELEAHLIDDHLQSDSGPVPILKAPHIDVGEIEAFMKKSDMRERVQLKCPLCECMYDKLAQYQDHMTSSHRGKAWDKDGLCSAVLKVTTEKTSSVKPVIKDDPTESAPGKVYSCNRCGKKVFGRDPMRRHATTHHDNEIIQCTMCCEFFITQASYNEHKKHAHLSLLNLKVKHLNKHGDIRGDSIDDILKANDCLSKTCCEAGSKFVTTKTSANQMDETIYVDLDSKYTIIHEVVQFEPTKNPSVNAVISSTNKSNMKDCTVKGSISRPNWKTHKRERSDDSLPDPESPMYNLLLLCKSAVREQKRIAVQSEGGNEAIQICDELKDTSQQNTSQTMERISIIKKLVCHEVLQDEAVNVGNCTKLQAKLFLSFFHALTGLAAVSFLHLRKRL
ncbi:hypothetical protein ACHWQZ_G011418 [Mnemiopsis leidyi]